MNLSLTPHTYKIASIEFVSCRLIFDSSKVDYIQSNSNLDKVGAQRKLLYIETVPRHLRTTSEVLERAQGISLKTGLLT